MPEVFNKYKNPPPGAVYIGRPTKWGNPFTHLVGKTKAEFLVKDREESVASFRTWFLAQPELVAAVKKELKGKDLICWCKPASCHGDVLIEIANQD